MAPGFTFDQALAEADRCLLCHDAPCSKGCPAGTDPGTFIRKLRMRNILGAIRTIKENNILGGACGVLCPTPRLCEKECSATGLDRPIRIGKIQRFLIEHSWEIGFRTFQDPRREKPARREEKVAVVGAGPAGLSCAAELAKSGIKTVVFEDKPEPGGVLRFGVPTFRFSREFLDKELGDLDSLGVEIKCSHGLLKPGEVESLLGKGFKAVFVGTGLWKPLTLTAEKETGSGVLPSIAFLEDFRKKPDDLKKRVKGKTVGVIGGGSVAIDCARVAIKLGAGDVYLIYRRSFPQMPAEEDERLEALQEGVHFLLLNQPLGYRRDQGGSLTGISLARTRLGSEDSSGRRSPVRVPGSDWVLELDLAVEAIGNQAPGDSPALYPSVPVDKERLIRTNEKTCGTSIPGIFAGGDIVRGPATVVEAISDGKKAAGAILDFLKPRSHGGSR